MARTVKGKNQEATSKAPPFWQKPLGELTKTEWESLCDGCGRCCLVKLEDEDTGKIHYTDIACRLFEAGSCQCSNYKNRKKIVPDCITLNKKNVHTIPWLPPTCAYKLRAQGKELHWWHHLISGSRQTVHSAGISVRGRVGILEDELEIDDYPSRIVRWPGNAPKGKGGPEAGS